jgi:DcuC family C4-dicarboxylate transporter
MKVNRRLQRLRRLLGIFIAVASFACIAFSVIEPRLGLLAGAMVMFLIARSPSGWFREFVKIMGKTDFLKVILPVFAFISVATVTGCIDAFVRVLAAPLSGWGTLLVPVTVLATFLTNMALVSASASGLAVGGVFLPILITAGINPALAIASIVAGTWGAVLSPGSKHAAFIANAANESYSDEGKTIRVEAMDVVRGHARVVIPVLAIVIGLMWLEATLIPGALASTPSKATTPLDGVRTWVPLVSMMLPNEATMPLDATDWLRALVPLIPLVLLWILSPIRSARIRRWFPNDILVIQTMFFGIAVAAIVGVPQLVGKSPPGKNLAEAIFSGDGMAKAYGDVMTTIIAAMVFVAGLEVLGVIRGFVSMLKQQRRLSTAWFAFFGDMGFAALSGSGDAASSSFNLGVTPLARELGERPRELGSMAWLGAEMGRCFSPFAAVTISLANIKSVPYKYVASWTVAPIALAGLACVLLRRNIKG